MTEAQLKTYMEYITGGSVLRVLSAQTDDERYALARGMFFMSNPKKMHPADWLSIHMIGFPFINETNHKKARHLKNKSHN